MKNKKIILVVAISAFVSLFSMFGVTYALLFQSHTFENSIDYETSSLKLSMNYENSFSLNSLPMNNEEATSLDFYKVTINNDGNISYKYNLKLLSTISENIIDLNYIKVQVLIDDEDVLCRTKIDEKLQLCNENTSLNEKIYPTLMDLNNNLLSDKVANSNESKDVYIKFWLDENTPNSEIGKNFNAKLVLDAYSYYDTASIDENVNENIISNIVE